MALTAPAVVQAKNVEIELATINLDPFIVLVYGSKAFLIPKARTILVDEAAAYPLMISSDV
jgi:hypothetical protein